MRKRRHMGRTTANAEVWAAVDGLLFRLERIRNQAARTERDRQLFNDLIADIDDACNEFTDKYIYKGGN